MKKTLLILLLADSLYISMQAQTHYGTSAGTLGTNHSYFGYYAGNSALSSSSHNSFFGSGSGKNLTSAGYNTAIGFQTLYDNTTGHSNTAVGDQALSSNTNGFGNTATGRYALTFNTTGYYNVANGYAALYSNTTGYGNTATGSEALRNNTTGNLNVAVGRGALENNTTGNENTAVGTDALAGNTNGNGNSAFGVEALSMDGSYNCAFGAQALLSVCTGSCNTAFGARAGLTLYGTCNRYNSTALGYNAPITSSNQVRIGNSAVTSIGGHVAWSTLSDGRFKVDLKKDVAGLDFINQLNPVSYTFDREAIDKFLGVPDSVRIGGAEAGNTMQRQTGFIAQEVERLIKKSGYVFTGVETPQNENDPYTLRYEEFVVPLVNAVHELTAAHVQQQKDLEELKQQLGRSGSEISINDPKPDEMLVFQNDSNGVAGNIKIDVMLPDVVLEANIIISDLDGKPLKEIQVTERGSTTMTISRSEFSTGMYLYVLVADGEIVDAKHLVLAK